MAKEVNKKDSKKEEKTTKSSSNVKGMRAELKKVTWPTRKELINSTTAVIVIVIITAIIVFFLDFVFGNLNNYGFNKLREIYEDKATKNEVTTTQNAEEVVIDENTPTTIEGEDVTVEEPIEGDSTENTETDVEETPVTEE